MSSAVLVAPKPDSLGLAVAREISCRDVQQLREAHAVLLVHVPDDDLCRECLELARLVLAPCPLTRTAKSMVDTHRGAGYDASARTVPVSGGPR